MLHAYWDACSANGVTVTLDDAAKGAYTFSRTFDLGSGVETPAREYVVTSENFRIPSANKDVSFNGIAFVVTADDVILDPQAKFKVKGIADNASWFDFSMGDKLTAGLNFGAVKAPLLKNSYKFAYDKNWDEPRDVFVSSNKIDEATYTIANVSDVAALQLTAVMGRTDACLTGWALDKDGDATLSQFDMAALRKLDALVNNGKSVDTLYAVWTASGTDGCSPTTFTVKSGMDATQGTFQVYQTIGTNKLWYDVVPGDEGVKIPSVAGLMLGVKFTAASPAYTFGDNIFVDAENANGQIIPDGSTFEIVNGQKNVTLHVTSDAVTYTIAFNENDSHEAYFGDSWAAFINDASFTVDGDSNWVVKSSYNVNSSNKQFPMAMYRNGMCLQGYTFEQGDRTAGVFTELNSTFIETLKSLGKNPAATTLYALWGPCSGPDSTIVNLDGTSEGSYKFSRIFALNSTKNTPVREYVASAAEFKVPSSHNDVSFNGIEFVVNDVAGVILDTQAKIQVKATAENATWEDYTNGENNKRRLCRGQRQELYGRQGCVLQPEREVQRLLHDFRCLAIRKLAAARCYGTHRCLLERLVARQEWQHCYRCV